MHEYGAYAVMLILLGTLICFVWGRWRYDVIAFTALILSVLIGVIPFKSAFVGFSSSAVVSVLCIMIISKVLTESGVIDQMVRKVAPAAKNLTLSITLFTLVGAVLSAFMNNVGALTLMMPIVIQTSLKNKLPLSWVLMPLSFGTILGGLSTMIGTPPNILISNYRAQITGHEYHMFSFAPVGAVLAVLGVLFVAFVGWRLLPKRKTPRRVEDLFELESYTVEVKITEKSTILGLILKDLPGAIEENILVIGLIRGRRKRLRVLPHHKLHINDVLLVQASHEALDAFVDSSKVDLLPAGAQSSDEREQSENVSLIEVVVPQGSLLDGKSASQARLFRRWQVNLLALSREGNVSKERLNRTKLQAGDVLLIQGDDEELQAAIGPLGVLPLLERGVKLGIKKRKVLPVLAFAISIILAGFQVLPIQIALAAAVIAMVLCGVIQPKKLREWIDWPIIILLGAMIPIGGALQTTGATALIANDFVSLSHYMSPTMIIALLFIITMTLSDLMNNVATALVMAPIAVTIAQHMGMNIDPFLMTVAVGSSCSFLTPISHQNNMLVMGPGGYHFGDYLRMGLPLEIMMVIVGVPMIMWVWPLS